MMLANGSDSCRLARNDRDHLFNFSNLESQNHSKKRLQVETPQVSRQMKAGLHGTAKRETRGRQVPLTMNSWPSTLVSPLDLCSSVIQWCISSGVSALQWSTRLAVIITKELGLSDRAKGSKASAPPQHHLCLNQDRPNAFALAYRSQG